MRRGRALGLAALLMLAGANVASATPLSWSFKDILFEDGTTVSGSFSFDAATGLFDELAMETSGSTSVPSTNTWYFNTLCVGCQQNANGVAGFVLVNSLAPNLIGAQVISLFSISGPLFTSLGGALAVEFAVAGTCFSADCALFDPALPNSQDLVSGQFVSDTPAIPEPASLLLLGGGLGAIRFFLAKRTARR